MLELNNLLSKLINLSLFFQEELFNKMRRDVILRRPWDLVKLLPKSFDVHIHVAYCFKCFLVIGERLLIVHTRNLILMLRFSELFALGAHNLFKLPIFGFKVISQFGNLTSH